MTESCIAITVRREDPASLDGQILLDELSATLAVFSGDGGQSRFCLADFHSSKGRFYVARTLVGEPVGCGAFWHFDSRTAELKRIYSRPHYSGVGKVILQQLEVNAAAAGYQRLVLETRAVNRRAIRFYERNGFRAVQRYGSYVEQSDACCFEKMLLTAGGEEAGWPTGRQGGPDRSMRERGCGEADRIDRRQ
ncbi:ribosomal protein S18 acetylase RimI-like enzyme [Paraburkholderia youngii]|uniref:GNAT family N-acetyltransferase n=1 Tax=Paraburkholderia youngii TaxID=2782701 RepID=UPI003D1B64A7